MRVTASGRTAAAVFYIVNVLLFPITLIGYVLTLARIYVARRASGASITAQGPLWARASMHQLGLRRDDAAFRLLMALPSTSGLAMLLTAGPVLLAHRLTGYVPSAFRYPFEGDVPPQFEASARVTFVDAAVERNLATINQFVILGAGFDTRAFRLPRPGQIRCFEVDVPRTQAAKQRLLLWLVWKQSGGHARQSQHRSTGSSMGVRFPRSNQCLGAATVQVDIGQHGHRGLFSSDANRRPKPSGSRIVKSRKPYS
jgi:Leucine carboxyl methyltransferase